LQDNLHIIVNEFWHAGIFDALEIIHQDELPDYESDGNSDFEEDIMEPMDRTCCYLDVSNVYSESEDDNLSVIVITNSEEE